MDPKLLQTIFLLQTRNSVKRLNDTTGLHRRVINNICKTYEIPVPTIENMVKAIKSGPNQEANIDKLEFCIAHASYNAPCYSELLFKHMCAFFCTNPSAIRAPTDEFNVVSIDGGAGHDVIGFINAFEEVQLSTQKINVTIVDKNIKWQIFFSVAISEGLAWGHNTSFSKILNKMEFGNIFIHTRVGNRDKETGGKIKEAVEKANFVIAFDAFGGDENIIHILEEITEYMKAGSLLYLGGLDTLSVPGWVNNFLQRRFKIVYMRNEVAAIVNDTAIMGIKCKMLCKGIAVILQKSNMTVNVVGKA